MSHVNMRKADICLCKNKDTDQMCSDCITDQPLFLFLGGGSVYPQST